MKEADFVGTPDHCHSGRFHKHTPKITIYTLS